MSHVTQARLQLRAVAKAITLLDQHLEAIELAEVERLRVPESRWQRVRDYMRDWIGLPDDD